MKNIISEINQELLEYANWKIELFAKHAVNHVEFSVDEKTMGEDWFQLQESLNSFGYKNVEISHTPESLLNYGKYDVSFDFYDRVDSTKY